jgi:hypothetical protein
MKVTVEFDTETKDLVVKEGSSVMENVDGVSFYKCYCCETDKDEFSMSITQCEEKVEGVTKRIYSMAKVFGLKDEN